MNLKSGFLRAPRTEPTTTTTMPSQWRRTLRSPWRMTRSSSWKRRPRPLPSPRRPRRPYNRHAKRCRRRGKPEAISLWAEKDRRAHPSRARRLEKAAGFGPLGKVPQEFALPVVVLGIDTTSALRDQKERASLGSRQARRAARAKAAKDSRARALTCTPPTLAMRRCFPLRWSRSKRTRAEAMWHVPPLCSRVTVPSLARSGPAK